MKAVTPFLAILLALSTPVKAASATSVLDLRIGDARQENVAIRLPDQTGNGYDVVFPSGATLEEDPDLNGKRVLSWSGGGSRPLCAINCLEMPSLNCTLKVKPMASAFATSDIICINGAWALRYNASRNKFMLWVYPRGEDPSGKSSRIDLEVGANVGAWNDIWISVTAERIEFRVNDHTVAFSAAVPNLKLVPIRNGAVLFFRPDQGAKFVGSISDVLIGFKSP